MSRTPLITAIDLGTDKCVTLIAAGNPQTNQLEVLGVSAVPSAGIRKSNIIDLEAAIGSVAKSVEGAERMAGKKIRSAFVSLGGAHIGSQNSRGVVAVSSPNQEISPDDIQRVIESAKAVSVPTERSILHVIPKDFRIDSQGGIKDPLGMTGIRLESQAHIVTALQVALKNLEKCLHDLGIGVDGFVFSGLASGELVATETEKELGVAVLDIGAGSSSLCVYVEGSLDYSASLPIGARHITQDIALGCRISIEAAEKIKTFLASEDIGPPMPKPGESKDDLAKRRKKADQLNPSDLGITESIGELSKKTIIEGIMFPRLREVFHLLGKELQDQDLFPMIPAGIIITGGGAETVGISEVAKKTLRLPIRLGQPPQLPGLTADLLRPTFATSIGLIEYGWKQGGGAIEETSFSLPSIPALPSAISPGKIITAINKLIKSILP